MSTGLLATQRQFLHALLEPLSGENRALAELPAGAAAPSDRFNATADALLCSTETVAARERLSLYHRQYWFRLLDSLAEDFPRVRALLGDAVWHAAAERCLLAQPPATWTLRRLGAGLADFLRQDTALPAHLRPWAAALAAFEYAHMQVFEAAEWPMPADADLATGVLALQPGVELVPVDRPISRLLARSDFRPATDSAPQRELHVVWRTAGHALHARREPLALLPLLQALQRGGPLEAVIASTRSLPAPTSVQAAFARWRSLGWLALAPAASLSTPSP